MKIKRALIAILFIVTLFSCSTDKDDEIEIYTIDGVWSLIDIDLEGSTTYNYDGVDVPVTFEGNGYNMSGDFTINEDGTYEDNTVFSIHLTITVLGQNQEENLEDLTLENQAGTWVLNQEELTLTNEETGEVVEANAVLSANGNTLTIETTREFEVYGTTANANITLVFSKQ